jgi:hypothetical protein
VLIELAIAAAIALLGRLPPAQRRRFENLLFILFITDIECTQPVVPTPGVGHALLSERKFFDVAPELRASVACLNCGHEQESAHSSSSAFCRHEVCASSYQTFHRSSSYCALCAPSLSTFV